ncbi:TetR/AcrR family transcriptional regulator [Streptomyces sp. BI20]|uniref:TetR/AcrR family transcriptional regulator n=1 Tax=Streptomyces sp. BI20 TaxID=3403460 RepID=UPI003C70BF10
MQRHATEAGELRAPDRAPDLIPPTAPAAPDASGRRMPRPRADALRNRERILVAARELYVEQGTTAAFDEIARRAGVGNATLYRHFPDRVALVRHVVLHVLERITEHARAARVEEADAFDAVCRFAHAAADERIGALCPLLSEGFDHDHPDLLAGRETLETAVEDLIRHGQEAGALRPDIGAGDLMMALSQLARPLPGTCVSHVDRYVHRHLQLLLDGLRAPGRSALPGSPATVADLRREDPEPVAPARTPASAG